MSVTIKAQALQLLNIDAANPKAQAILNGWFLALDITDVCSRCGGSGSYSYNQIDGTRCYKCFHFPAGKVPAKLTRKTLETLRACVEAGDVERIRADRKANRAALKSLGALEAEARAQYDRISNQYTAAYKASQHTGDYTPGPIFRAQTMANAIFWGPETLDSSRSVHGVIRDVKMGWRKDYVRCAQDVRDAIEMLRAWADAWEAFAPAA